MAEPTARIESASSYREPDAQPAPGRLKEKPQPKAKAAVAGPELLASSDADDLEKHQLDTLA